MQTAACLVWLLACPAVADPLDTWTRVEVGTVDGDGAYFTAAAYGNGRYVAVGQKAFSDAAFAATSEDGSQWTQWFPSYEVRDLYSVAFGNGLFVAVGWGWLGSRNIYSAPDGVNWTEQGESSPGNLFRVIFGNGRYVAVGQYEATNRCIFTSINGTNWTGRSSGAPLNDVQRINDVAYGNGRFVAVGGGYYYTSTTGGTWSASRFSSYSPANIGFGASKFIAPCAPGVNLLSSDGASWVAVTNTTAAVLRCIVPLRGRLVGMSSKQLFVSRDATNWATCDFQAPSDLTLTDVVVGPRNLVVVGYYSAGGLPSQPAVYISAPLISLGIDAGTTPRLNLSGTIGGSYRIEYRDIVQSGAIWQALTNVTLTNSDWSCNDLTSVGSAGRFYRAVYLP